MLQSLLYMNSVFFFFFFSVSPYAGDLVTRLRINVTTELHTTTGQDSPVQTVQTVQDNTQEDVTYYRETPKT